MKYTVEAPPKNWAHYPLAFLKVAIPILNAYDNLPTSAQFAMANRDLTNMGLNDLRAKGGFPDIRVLKAEKTGSESVKIEYDIFGSEEYDYYINISLYNSKGEHINNTLMGTKQLKAIVSKDGVKDVSLVKLTVHVVGISDAKDSKSVKLVASQPKLLDE